MDTRTGAQDGQLSRGLFTRLLAKVVDVRPAEVGLLFLSALYFFLTTRIIARGPESDPTGHEFEINAGEPEKAGA